MADRPDDRDIIEDMEKKFGKMWGEFDTREQEETVRAAIGEARGDIREAIRLPLILDFYFKTGGPEKWGAPNLSSQVRPESTRKEPLSVPEATSAAKRPWLQRIFGDLFGGK